MGWKECSQVDEKLKFIARLIEGEIMAHPEGFEPPTLRFEV